MKRSNLSLNARRVCFRKWGNKSYSVFASLKALVKISAVSATYSLVCMPSISTAQEHTDTLMVSKNIDIDEVVINAPQAATTFSELTRAMVVITKEDFSGMPVHSLQDLLENFASVDIRQRGSHGVQADLMVRGGSFDQVLVLLNGVNITDPQTGHHNLNIPIDLESIERIELLQGPGTRVYGPGTFSGVINIITTNKRESYAKASIKAGEYGLMKATTSAAINAKKIGFFVAASSVKSNGYMENTDFSIHNIFAHANHLHSNGSFDFQAGYQGKAFGAQNFYSVRFPNQFEETGALFTSASYSHKLNNLTITPTAYLRNHTDRFELFRYESPEWYNGHNYHTTLVTGGKLQLSLIHILGRSRMGAEIRNERIASSVLGLPLSAPKPVSKTNAHYTHGANRVLTNFYVDHTIYLSRLIISGGGLFNYSNNFGANMNYGFDLSYRIFNKVNLITSINNAIRFPTFTDLYYEGPTNYGNIDLKPETANNFELGIKQSGVIINSNASLFHRRGKNVIDWVKNEDDVRWTTMNHTEINSTGIEWFVQLKTLGIVPLVNSLSANYYYMYSDKSSGEVLSYYALDYLRQKLSLGVSHKIFKNFSANWALNWQERSGTFTHYPSDIETPYNSFTILDLRINWLMKHFSAYIDFKNLANTQYFDLGNIPQPGRWMSIGFSFNTKEPTK